MDERNVNQPIAQPTPAPGSEPMMAQPTLAPEQAVQPEQPVSSVQPERQPVTQPERPIAQPTQPEQQPIAQPQQPAFKAGGQAVCPSCGAAAQLGAAFCVACGAGLGVQPQQPEQPEAQPAYQPQQPIAQPEQPAAGPAPQQPFGGPQPAQPVQPEQPMPGMPVPPVNYGQAAGYAQPANQGGTAALVCGILAIVLGLFSPLIGVILGIVAIVQAKKWVGASKAKIGRTCGIIGIVISAVMFVIGMVAGVSALTSIIDDGLSDTASTIESLDSGSSSSGSDGYVAEGEDEAYVQSLVEQRFDALANGDEYLDDIALLASAGFEQGLEVTMSECGVSPSDYAAAMTDGLTYSVDIVVLDADEGTGWVGVYVNCKDIFDVLASFNTAIDEFDASGQASNMTENQVMLKIGELFMNAVNSTPITDESNYAIINVAYQNGEWVIDEESWDYELDYMFNVI